MQGATGKENNETDQRNKMFLFYFLVPEKTIWQKSLNYFL